MNMMQPPEIQQKYLLPNSFSKTERKFIFMLSRFFGDELFNEVINYPIINVCNKLSSNHVQIIYGID